MVIRREDLSRHVCAIEIGSVTAKPSDARESAPLLSADGARSRLERHEASREAAFGGGQPLVGDEKLSGSDRILRAVPAMYPVTSSRATEIRS